MKRFLPLIILTILASSGFSQSLRPVIKDSLLCFTTSQAKDIAKRIVELDGCTEERAELTAQIATLDTLVLNKNKQIALLKSEIFNSKEIYKAQSEIATNLQADLNKCNRKQATYKLTARIGIITSLVLGTLLLVK